MEIKLIGTYKSLSSFESKNLPDFLVITGKNGSGKSQLFELFKNYTRNSSNSENSHQFILEPSSPNIQAGKLEPLESSRINKEQWRSDLKIAYNTFSSFGRENIKRLIGVMLEKGKWIHDLNHESILKDLKTSELSSKEVENLLRESLYEINGRFAMSEKTRRRLSPLHKIIAMIKSGWKLDYKYRMLLQEVVKNRNKKVHELKEADFYKSNLHPKSYKYVGLFTSKIEFIFYDFLKRRDQNSRLYFEKERFNRENNSVSEEQFEKENKAPWKVINEILAGHQIDFRFRGPEISDFSDEVSYSFWPIKNHNGKVIEIPFKWMSSGEKVIIGLILKLFTNDTYQEVLQFPDIIFLDEPDAHLHPEMTRLLIEVLNETFVKKFNINVIITTHSPSTVALSPDESIYELQNEPETSLKYIGKGAALKLLTGNIPTLSIDYENHKQVFVESPTDVYFYQTLFRVLNGHFNYPFRLYFISAANGKGNCDSVKNIVKDIRESGNSTSYGIIDWDKRNTSSDYVKVHGEGKRYSVENFLYDPIYLSVWFMEVDAHNIRKALNVSDFFDQYSVKEYSSEQLQEIADWFFGNFAQKFPAAEEMTEEKWNVEYYNGMSIDIPIGYLTCNGHGLEKKLKKVFPVLNSKDFKNEGALQKKLTNIMGRCYPLIPKESVDLIESIINIHNPSEF